MTINVKIAERFYPFIIEKEDDEEQIRKAAQLINDKLSRYKTQYSDRDMQDYLAIIALQFMVKLIKFETTDLDKLTGQLNRMNSQLEDFLAPNN